MIKVLLLLSFLSLLSGCAQSGYSPSYIISDVGEEGYDISPKEPH